MNNLKIIGFTFFAVLVFWAISGFILISSVAPDNPVSPRQLTNFKLLMFLPEIQENFLYMSIKETMKVNGKIFLIFQMPILIIFGE